MGPSSAGGTIVATVENGKIKYFSLGDRPGTVPDAGATGGLRQRDSRGGWEACELRPSTPSASEMLGLRELLPFIAEAVGPNDPEADDDEDGGENGR